jgi:hypothetical protein
VPRSIKSTEATLAAADSEVRVGLAVASFEVTEAG